MMFRRRKPLGWGRKFAEFFWPRAGWRRALRYWWYRLVRLRASPHSIAAGVASGVAVSFTPFLGLHLVLAALLSLAVRGNVVAGLIGTAFGNPWTFLPIWLATAWLGSVLLGTEIDLTIFAAVTREQIAEAPFGTFRAVILPIIWPMAVGGAILGAIAWWSFYLPLRWSIEGFRRQRAKRIAAKQAGRRKFRRNKRKKELPS